MTVSTSVNLEELYEIDDYLWLQETVRLLKEKKFSELDLTNLIEELDDLGNEKRNKVESLLEQIIRHCLLLEYWKSEYETNSQHWESEIVAFRTQLRKNLTTNLYNYLESQLTIIYKDAVRFTERKSRLTNFPTECPYNLAQLLNEDWFPQI